MATYWLLHWSLFKNESNRNQVSSLISLIEMCIGKNVMIYMYRDTCLVIYITTVMMFGPEPDNIRKFQFRKSLSLRSNIVDHKYSIVFLTNQCLVYSQLETNQKWNANILFKFLSFFILAKEIWSKNCHKYVFYRKTFLSNLMQWDIQTAKTVFL